MEGTTNCDLCSKEFHKKNFARHLESKTHKRRMQLANEAKRRIISSSPPNEPVSGIENFYGDAELMDMELPPVRPQVLLQKTLSPTEREKIEEKEETFITSFSVEDKLFRKWMIKHDGAAITGETFLIIICDVV